MLRDLYRSLGLLILLTLLTGLAYPFLVLGVGQSLMARQANGSLILRSGHTIGSSLIGQNFSSETYFHPRPSAAGDKGYDASNSSGSNYGPTSPDLIKAVDDRIAGLRLKSHVPIPVDLVTSSASGLDPDISLDAARLQGPRIAEARKLDPNAVMQLIDEHTTSRTFGILGENRVNVLEINLALDQLSSRASASP